MESRIVRQITLGLKQVKMTKILVRIVRSARNSCSQYVTQTHGAWLTPARERTATGVGAGAAEAASSKRMKQQSMEQLPVSASVGPGARRCPSSVFD